MMNTTEYLKLQKEKYKYKQIIKKNFKTKGDGIMIDFELLKKVVEQIKKDADIKDYTAIEELLKDISTENLKGFLSEEK